MPPIMGVPTRSIWLIAAVLTLVTGCSAPPLHQVEGVRAELSETPEGPDGVQLTLTRYRPQLPQPEGPRFPVVLCHGFGSTGSTWDLAPERSLAIFLALKGFDAWVLELRGAGRSKGPGRLNPFGWTWTFDDYLRVDLPLAIRHVLDETDADRVHWVGHSMGGMLLYAWLGLGGDAYVQSGTAVGSPADFTTLNEAYGKVFATNWLSWLFPMVPADWVAPLGAWIPIPAKWDHLIWNRANVEPEMADAFLASGASAFSSALARQFFHFGLKGRFASMDGRFDYLQRLRGVATPVLFVAGRLDNLGRPEMVRPAYEALGSPDKRFHLVGVDSGARHDYGHMDLTMGQHVVEEVYPVIHQWLMAHEPKPGSLSGSGTGP